MPDPRRQMQSYDFLVALVGASADAPFVHVLQPVGEKLPDFLLRSCDEYALLLLVQCFLELFLNLLSRFPIVEFALSSFKRDLSCPPAVFTPVDGAFATPALLETSFRLCRFSALSLLLLVLL